MTSFKQPLAIHLAKLFKRRISYTYYRVNRYSIRVSEFSGGLSYPSFVEPGLGGCAVLV